MDHLCSSAHPFSLSRRVDYCLDWPQFLPSPSFHFSSADIYWSLSEKFPSSHPFPKVELQRKSSRLVCVCMCAWFINEPERAFIFLTFFCCNFVLSCLFSDSQPVCPFCLFLSNPVLSPSIFLPCLDPYIIPSHCLSSSLYIPLSLHSSFPSQGGCTAFWTSTPVWFAGTAARVDLTSVSTVSSSRTSPPPLPLMPRTPPWILGCPL